MVKKLNQTQTISDILNTFTFGQETKGKSLSYAVKFSTIVNFWEDIIGKKLAKFTKPTEIKYSKLYISAKNSAIVQEVLFNKQKILTKLNTYSQALSITVKDLVLDYKNYSAQTKIEAIPKDDIPKFYTNKELEKVELKNEVKENIKNSVEKLSFIDENKKNELAEKICNLKKAQIKRKTRQN